MDLNTMGPELLANLIKLGQALGEPIEGFGGNKLIPTLPGMVLTEIKNPNPTRIRENPQFDAAESFAEYVKEFKDRTGKTQIFGSLGRCQFDAAIDWHAPGDTPQARSHSARFSPKLDEAWAAWNKAASGKPMSQTEFAHFIEERCLEIMEPQAAQMMEIATDLNIKVEVSFSSKKNLSNGLVEIAYKEASEGGTTPGKLTIPKHMTVRMPIFFGEPARDFTVFLRYDAKPGNPLTFRLDIWRAEYILQEAFLAIATRIGEATGIIPKLGTPA